MNTVIGRSVIFALACLLVCLASLSRAGVPVSLFGTNADGLPSLSPMLRKVTPAVVNIATYTHVRRSNPLLQDPFFRRFFAIPERPSLRQGTPKRRTQSAGSGVIVNAAEGLILTNHHVIDGADEIEVTLQDGRTLAARLLGSDKQVDIALLQIKAERLSEVKWVDSSSLSVGDFVVAIGNPFGLGQTVTSGIVSALGRSGLGIYGYEDFIQTDASINPGNSGGALVNLKGELIGINSAIIAPAGGNVGIGFAIPAEIAHNVMLQLQKFGAVRRGQLGVIFQDLTADLSDALGLPIKDGALVVKVAPGTPAAEAGIHQGDVVVSVDGRKIRHSIDFHNRIGLTPVGSKMELTVFRSGKFIRISAVVGERGSYSRKGDEFHALLTGVIFKNYYGNRQDDQPMAVVVVDLEDGPAKSAGLRRGDIIVSSNRYRVRNMRELKKVVALSDQVLFRIERDGRSYYLVIR
ncbi:MAG: serine endoprotease DegQ [Gammaproteobacteria bacterium]|nr:MAG: serine endoprotease DegQ [Pseudomonadota bacterium]PIE38499.1 MAG: serine endoprotease DegQ [Gammaproteobacteria bacterium]